MTNLFINYNWGSTRTQHQITTKLCETADVNAIGASVVGRKPYEFLQQQDDIKYDPLFCVQDIHNDLIQKPYSTKRLNDLEARYGNPFLWPAIWADRKYIDYRPEKQKRLLQGWFDFYIDVFETFDPDLFMTTSVDSSYTWIPFRIVNRDYGTAVQKSHTRIRDRKSVQESLHDHFKHIWDRFENIHAQTEGINICTVSEKNAIDFLEEFRNNKGISPGYMDTQSETTSSSSVVREAISYWWQKNFGNYKDDFYHGSTCERIIVSLKRLIRKRLVDRLGLFQRPDLDRDYVYFPLHLQPEASTMVRAPMYIELPDVIRNISKSLPVNYKLYVKEHPTLYRHKIRPMTYYEEIDDLPNTELIDPAVDSHALIRSADVVTTITGTAGLEGLFFKKPVITFGGPYYDRLTQVSRAGDPKDLASLIENSITEFCYTKEHETELVDLMTAVFKESYPSPMDKSGAALEAAIDAQCEMLKRHTVLGDD